MRLSPNTVAILKNFSAINSNLCINKGKKITTISPSKDVIVTYEGEDEFSDSVSIFNLNEFLGVLGAFETPDLVLDTKFMTIMQGKQKVQYNYADASLLILPPAKGITFPVSNVSFDLSDASLAKLQKMSAILAAPDFSVIGDKGKITLKVFDKNNSSTNKFELDTEVDTSETFQINFKIDKLKLMPGNYTVDISSKKISKFSHAALKLVYLVAIEADSEFS